jgi:hypothetical protein
MDDVSPQLFVDTAMSYQKTAAIKAAIELGLFAAIGSSPRTVKELAVEIHASPRGVRILCDYLTVQGFLAKTRDKYELMPSTAAFLDTRSPAYMGDVIQFIAAPELMQLFLKDPVTYVRNGGSKGLASLAPDHPLWTRFAKAMVPFIAPTAQAIAEQVAAWPESDKPRKVLDIAAGHGVFGHCDCQGRTPVKGDGGGLGQRA